MKKRMIGLWVLLAFSAPFASQVLATSAQQYDAMGSALYDKGFYSQALDYFKNAVQADPYDWQGYQNMGNAFLKLNDSQQAAAAYQQSLQINPQNIDLKRTLDNLSYSDGASQPNSTATGITAAPVVPSQPISTPNPLTAVTPVQNPQPAAPQPTPIPTPVSAPPTALPTHPPAPQTQPRPKPFNYFAQSGLSPIDSASVWFKVQGGYNYSLLTDLADSADIENKMIAANSWSGTALMSSNGIHLGFELGFLINANNGLALGVDYLQPNHYLLNQNLLNGNPSDFENESFSIDAIPLTLNYYFFLPDNSGRFFFNAGVGYYFTTVQVTDNYSYLITHAGSNDQDDFTGNLTANAIGFELGAGREFAINSFLGVSVFVKGRYAPITNLIGTVTKTDGQTAQYGLASFQDGEVHAVNVSYIGYPGVKYATVDLTGFDAGFGIDFYP